jgi:hypothetical protein
MQGVVTCAESVVLDGAMNKTKSPSWYRLPSLILVAAWQAILTVIAALVRYCHVAGMLPKT